MKKIFWAIVLIGFAFSIVAQETVNCVEAAEQASIVIDSAQDLLADGNIIGASTLLDAAKTLLNDCGNGAESGAPLATAASVSTLAPTAVLETTETSVSSNPTDSSANYTLTAPIINEDEGIAFVRFANTSVDIGAIDIYMGNDNVLILSNLSYGEATEFVPINAGQRDFRARRHDAGADSEVLYQMNWNFVGNSSWIVTAAGLLETFAFIVEPISVVRNEYDGQARVRIVNLVAGAPRITVTTDSGLVLGDGLGWVGLNDTLLTAGNYSLQVSTDEGGSLPEALSFDFAANVTYTLYVIGRGTGEQPIQILNMVSPEDATFVKFVNNSSAVLDLHYRPSNTRLIESLAIGSESEWLSLPSGSYTFLSYAPNTGPTGQELAGIAVQLRPARYMIFNIQGNPMELIYEGLYEPSE